MDPPLNERTEEMMGPLRKRSAPDGAQGPGRRAGGRGRWCPKTGDLAPWGVPEDLRHLDFIL